MPVLKAENVCAALLKGSSARLADGSPARFTCGQRVRAHNINPRGHTRIPRYVRGRHGVVRSDQGVLMFPGTHADGEKVPQRLNSVRFTGAEPWGPQGSEDTGVHLDFFEAYPAPAR